MAESQPTSLEPTVLGAVWRYRWLVAFLAIAFAGLGWFYGTSNEEFTATGVLSVQDPRSSNLFDQGASSAPDRYVEDQATILRSRVVARDAVVLLEGQDPPMALSVGAVVQGLSVSARSDSNSVTVSYTAATPTEAIAVVNAVAVSYQGVSRATAEAQFAAALTELDETIAEIQSELEDLQVTIAQVRAGQANIVDLQTALDEARTELLAFEQPSDTADAIVLALANARLTALQLRITTLNAALQDDPNDPALATLADQQAEARRRLSDIQTTRDGLKVDSELAGSGVVFYAPAETAAPSSVGLWVVLGALVGAIVGAGIAFLLAQRKRRFVDRAEPELILGVPLVTDIPTFTQERLKTMLPVVEAPESASAEAFRFVAAGITVQQVDRSGNGSAAFKTVAITSAGLFDGKTTVAANTAFAAAREGGRVLVIDADFGNEALTRLLAGDVQRTLGMTDVAQGTTTLDDAVIRVSREHAASISLLTRGNVDISAPDFFASTDASRVLATAALQYDLVIIDSPPLLRVAYGTTIARGVDRLIAVVSHGTEMATAAELRDRLDLIGTPVLGYVYNQAPLRPEMTVSAGSMANPLGRQQATRQQN